MKHHIRQEMRAALAAMPADVASEKGSKACQALLSLPEFRRARVVMLYLDISNEIDASTLADAAWKADKTVLVPQVTWEHKYMVAKAIHSLEEGLVLTKQGLREPADGEPWPVEDIDLVVVPALAYDEKGNRLGRGGGFYDRFLASPGMRAVTCGLAFDEQVVKEVPTHDNDYPMDILVTNERVLRFPRNGRPRVAQEQ
ncbi:MAG: 5-formyltetrahydrofolate cyclo-ligase [Planctomycetes bacterium]|nr:5-formyltetrahydrofolate cyclo-ligase [Planctomycetota bacterium]